MTKQKLKKSSNAQWAGSAILISGLLAFIFLRQTLLIAQSVRQSDVLGSPNTPAGLLSAVLAVYAWYAGNRLRYKFASIIILAVLATSFIIWFLGLTEAGSIIGL